MSKSVSTNSPSAVNTATVVKVYPETRTVDVEIDLSGEGDILPNVPYGTLYTNSLTGTHVDFVPEVGSKCLVFSPSDGTMAIVMGWYSPTRIHAYDPNDTAEPVDDYLGGRLGLAPGDMALYNANGATVILRKGGTLQIGSSPMAQTIYIPIDNFIRHFFQNYEAQSLLGSVHWKHGAIQSTAGETSAQLFWGMKEKVEDSSVTIRVRAGSVDDLEFDPKPYEKMASTASKSNSHGVSNPGRTLISVCVDPNNSGLTYTFQVDHTGNCFIAQEGALHWEGRSFFAAATNGFTIEFGTSFKLSGNSSGVLEAVLSSLLITAANGCALSAPSITLGAGSCERSIKGETLLSMLLNHTHPFVGVAPGTPAVTSVPTGISSTCLSNKVRIG